MVSAATDDPDGFIAGLEGPVSLDEIQRVPDLFRAIKADVDRNRAPGRYLLTGSANVLMLPKLSESLAGRMEILPLWPLAQSEIDGRQGHFIDELFADRAPTAGQAQGSDTSLSERILRGGYPEACLRSRPDRRRAWFNSYVDTILQRDVRDLASIERLSAIPRLLKLLATRVGGLVNFAEISRSLGIPQTTLKRYIALFEATFLLQLLPAWSSNLGKRLVKSPKLYLNDTGLAAALVGQSDADGLGQNQLLGPFTENFLIMELLKQASWSLTQPGLFHFRTVTGREVDVVLESPSGRIVGVEIKAAGSVDKADLKGLEALKEIAGRRFHRGVVLYAGSQVVPFASHMHALPAQSLWLS